MKRKKKNNNKAFNLKTEDCQNKNENTWALGMDRFFRSKSYIQTCRAYEIKAESGIEIIF